MVEEISRAFYTIINGELAVHTVPSAGLAYVITISHEARRVTGVLTVGALQHFPTNAGSAHISGGVARRAEGSRAVTSSADVTGTEEAISAVVSALVALQTVDASTGSAEIERALALVAVLSARVALGPA